MKSEREREFELTRLKIESERARIEEQIVLKGLSPKLLC